MKTLKCIVGILVLGILSLVLYSLQLTKQIQSLEYMSKDSVFNARVDDRVPISIEKIQQFDNVFDIYEYRDRCIAESIHLDVFKSMTDQELANVYAVLRRNGTIPISVKDIAIEYKKNIRIYANLPKTDLENLSPDSIAKITEMSTFLPPGDSIPIAEVKDSTRSNNNEK